MNTIETRLEEILAAAKATETETDLSVFSDMATPILEHDLPKLVQALRRAIKGLQDVPHVYLPTEHSLAIPGALADIAKILTEGKE